MNGVLGGLAMSSLLLPTARTVVLLGKRFTQEVRRIGQHLDQARPRT
jgi:hypothetical protein